MMKDGQPFVEPIDHAALANRGAVRVHVVEGVPGSGKTIMIHRLRRQLDASVNRVITFSEEATVFSWQHFGLAGIDRIRLDLMDSIVTRIEEALATDPDASFLLERFHLTFSLLNHTRSLDETYTRLVERLRQLPVRVYVLTLEPDEIDARARHAERMAEDRAWAHFLEERLAASSESSLGEIYSAQQRELVRLAQAQGIDFRLEHISVPRGKPVQYDDE